jgi:excisionase family DNA binding protein
MTVPEVAKHLRISVAKVYAMAQRGDIPCTKIAGQWRFKREEVDVWMERQKQSVSATRETLESILNEALGVHLLGGAAQSAWEPNTTVREHLEKAFDELRSIFDRLDIDLIATELERPYSGPPHEPREAQRVRAFSGTLASVVQLNPQYSESVPWRFLHWRHPLPLRMQIIGEAGHSKPSPEQFQFITYKRVIEAAPRLDLPLDYILRESHASATFSEAQRRDAALVALESTEYSRALMDDQSLNRFHVDKSMRDDLALPHKDERNIVFLPSFVRGTPIGGAAVFSHRPLLYPHILLFAVAVHLILHRFRTVDDWGAVQLAAREQARWEATLIFIHRLTHDVRKPLDQARLQVRDFLSSTSVTDAKTKDFLGHLKTQLDGFGETLASRIGVSTEDLRRQAQADARMTPLTEVLQSALWLWSAEAEKQGKTITRKVEPDEETSARLPMNLVVEVLGNLVSNAVRFSRSLVDVRGRCKIYETGRRVVEFVVRDDGPGMTQEIWSQTFRRALSETPKLSGEGLYLSRFIAEGILGGSLRAEAKRPGLVVTFTFPEIQNGDVPL